MDEIDPPSFQFDRSPRRRFRREASEREAEAPEAPPEELEREPGPLPEPRVERRGGPPGGAPPEGPRRRRRLIKSETTARVLWAVPWVIFAIFIVAVGGLVFTLAVIGLAIAGLRELFRMAASRRPVMLPAYAAVAGMVLAAHYGDAFQVLLVLAAMFPAVFAFAAARESHEDVTVSIAITVLGVAWLGLAFSHAVLLRDLPHHGGALLIDVLVATFLGDTAAYAGGRLFGTRRITPRISPNKTLEGLISGFVGATLGFWFAGLYQDWLSGIDALLMGMCVGLLAPAGDLFASLIKRDLEVKDTGRLFGPHGGLIDRLDALLFTVVAGYYLSVAFVY